MAQDPIVTLIELNDATLRLNQTQTAIDIARVRFPTDQLFQLELDRHQVLVDEKRALIAETMADIRNRN